MKIKADLLRIHNRALKVDGSIPEPEETPVDRVLVTEANTRGTNGRELGTLNAELVMESSAGEIAGHMRRLCVNCKHFDPAQWERTRAAWEAGTPEQRSQVNAVRAALLETQNAQLHLMHSGADGDTDVEHALSFLGVCHPLTELERDAIIVHPLSSCPASLCSPSNPNGLFVAKDPVAEKRGSAEFDRIMQIAQGSRR